MIDPMKYRFSDDKPFPLKLLNSNHIPEALEFLKYDYLKYNRYTHILIINQYFRIEGICKTLLFRKIYVYLFWIYYCVKFQQDLISKFALVSFV